jgi:Rrf2 family cysteine metabolism transcriptional repressor
MRLSRRSEYGLRALVDLVRNDGNGPIPLATLAQRNVLPMKFLEQIMATLKHGGIVRTTLGAHGGYAMAADPGTITIGRVVRLLDGALAPLPCVSLRYYEPCSCPGRGHVPAPRRDDRRPRRDARDPRPGVARRDGRPARPRLHRSTRHPRGRPRRSAALRLPAQSRTRLRSAALTRSSSVPPIDASARAERDAWRASASE